MAKTVHIAITGAGTIDVAEIYPLQGDLVELTDENRLRLRNEILSTGFAFSPHVWRNPLDGTIYLLDGHQRVRVLKELREEGVVIPPIPVTFVEAESAAAAKRRILQARSQYGKMTEQGLASFAFGAGLKVDDIKVSFDFPQLDMDKFTEMFRVAGTEVDVQAHTRTTGLTDKDEAPDVRPTTIQLGDVFQMGRHRLMCGDSTSTGDVSTLMAGELADLVFTDPPYGVNYDGGHANPDVRREKIANDHSTEIYGRSIPLMFQFSKPSAALYLWFAATKSLQVLQILQANDYMIRSWLIWNKNMAQFGAIGAQYKQKHEPCIYAFKKGHPPFWGGPTNEISVWDVARASKNEFHPTQKPTALAERAASNSCPPDGIVLDLFGGSGSTMIAAESIGRSARIMEIAPSYCQVIIDRWEAYMGQKAQLLSAHHPDCLHVYPDGSTGFICVDGCSAGVPA